MRVKEILAPKNLPGFLVFKGNDGRHDTTVAVSAISAVFPGQNNGRHDVTVSFHGGWWLGFNEIKPSSIHEKMSEAIAHQGAGSFNRGQ